MTLSFFYVTIDKFTYKMASTLTASLWVKPAPFTYGALQVAPHPRLTPHVSMQYIMYHIYIYIA